MNQLTDYMQIAKLCFGRNRIYLAHVPSMILFFHIIDVQKPCAMLVVFVVCHTDARISRDHMIMYGQYGRLLEMYPRHLHEKRKEMTKSRVSFREIIFYARSFVDGSDNNNHHAVSVHSYVVVSHFHHRRSHNLPASVRFY